MSSNVQDKGCAFCGKLPGADWMLFTCHYCGGSFCPEHRIPEMHGCVASRKVMNVPGNAPVTLGREGGATGEFESEGPLHFKRRDTHGHESPPPTKRNRGLLKAAAILLLLILVGAVAYAYYQSNSQGANSTTSTSTTPSSVSSSTTTSLSSSSTSESSIANFISDPSFNNGKANITYPPEYDSLVHYALTLINNDRKQSGLGNVSLSSIPSGQQHADSLAYYGTIGHWDVQGYKPYMRYSLLGGTGYVAENVAENYCTNSAPSATSVTLTQCNLQTIENGIANGEYAMMNYDATCCNNGHRENILGPSHNRVSIGIAYDSANEAVYFVEDFEDSYISSLSLHLSGDIITFQGSTQRDLTGWTGSAWGAQIVVYYDPTPAGIDLSELTYSAQCNQYNELNEPISCQYRGAYNDGTQVSQVLAPCPAGYDCSSDNYTHAQTWQQSSGNFEIVFSISRLTAIHGSGVYTLYLYPVGDPTQPITSLSVFVTSG